MLLDLKPSNLSVVPDNQDKHGEREAGETSKRNDRPISVPREATADSASSEQTGATDERNVGDQVSGRKAPPAQMMPPEFRPVSQRELPHIEADSSRGISAGKSNKHRSDVLARAEEDREESSEEVLPRRNSVKVVSEKQAPLDPMEALERSLHQAEGT